MLDAPPAMGYATYHPAVEAEDYASHAQHAGSVALRRGHPAGPKAVSGRSATSQLRGKRMTLHEVTG